MKHKPIPTPSDAAAVSATRKFLCDRIASLKRIPLQDDYYLCITKGRSGFMTF